MEIALIDETHFIDMKKYLFVSFIIIWVSCEHQTRHSGNNELKITKSTIGDDLKAKDERDIFPLLKKQSKSEGKNLFLVFSFQGCQPCKIFENYHNDQVVKKILGKYLIVKKIDVNKTPGGSNLCKKYGKIGFPSWTILDCEGKVIIDSGNNNGRGNIGYPREERTIEYYINAIKKAAPALEQEECEILKRKLKEIYVKNVVWLKQHNCKLFMQRDTQLDLQRIKN